MIKLVMLVLVVGVVRMVKLDGVVRGSGWSAQLVSSEVLPAHPMLPLAASREWWDTVSAGRYHGILDGPCSHCELPRNSGTLHDVPMGNRIEY